LWYQDKKRSSLMITKPSFLRTFPWCFSLLLAFVFCLAGGLSTVSAASVQAPLSGAGRANAGKATSIAGTGKGSSTAQILSASQLAQRTQMLQRIHMPLPALPVTNSRGATAAPASTSPTKLATGQIQPQASVFVSTSDLGVHTSSQIDEPSVASSGQYILQTWNWYSGISTTSGASWTYYNPATLFPNSYGGWCCDSVATYNSSRNIYLWNLLYLPNASGGAFRIAVANGASGLAAASFHYWDLTPQQTGGATGDWYDYPVISFSNNDAYLQANVFNAAGSFVRTVVMRFSLDVLAATGSLGYNFFNTPGVASVTFTNGSTATMYFAGHLSTSSLRIFSWPESSGSISWNDVGHTSFPSGSFSCPRTGVANSNWCGRADSRPLGGWVSGGIIGFSWNAPQGKWGFSGSAPYPYTDIIRVNESTKALIDEPIVWNSGFAFMYMNFYPNSTGGVGGTFLYGGGSLFETAGATIWDTLGRDLVGIVASTQDATAAGDYLTTRPLGTSWAGTLYAMLSGGVHPYYITFHR
jgi:hypothetical protein